MVFFKDFESILNQIFQKIYYLFNKKIQDSEVKEFC